MPAKTGDRKIARRLIRRYGATLSARELERLVWLHGEGEARLQMFWKRRGWSRYPALYPEDPALYRYPKQLGPRRRYRGRERV